nr:G-type lectin S-receptor-like serine/threonine-protein kinase At4g27290 [Tanacetum cinerariifolium]
MEMHHDDTELSYFSLTEISKSTNDFSDDNKLGEGGFGPVYMGVLDDGREIAVKRLSKTSRHGLNEFKNELKFIAKLQHRNLVKLLGYCNQGDESMLIYEYMPNKSLDLFIFDGALPRPKQPAFFAKDSVPRDNSISVNDVTVTALEPR